MSFCELAALEPNFNLLRQKLRTHYFKHDRLPCDYCTHSALNPRVSFACETI